MRVRTALACLIVAACGRSSSSTTADARTADAALATVHEVTCPLGGTPTVTTSDSVTAFEPMMTAISAHDIVKFMMSPSHDVGPDSTLPSDSGLRVGFGQTACLKFDQAGTFHFLCTAHGFKGQIIVQ